MIYIIENNGVYGLTKGQFSATADLGSTLKTGIANDLPPFDCCALALKWGATFVARSFSGDKKQLQAIMKTAIAHRGLSVIDVISPCVTFNDHAGLHQELLLHEGARRGAAGVGFRAATSRIFPSRFPRAKCATSQMHDGSHLRIRKLDRDFDPTDRFEALQALEEAEAKGEVLTGVLYLNTSKPTFHRAVEPDSTSRWQLCPESKVRPPKTVLDAVMEELR